MKYRYILAATLVAMLPVASWAKTLTPAQALDRARSSAEASAVRGINSKALKVLHTTATPSGEPAVYLFGRDGAEGFIAVSADDCARALLGYTESGRADDTLPPALEWWLDEYARQIEYTSAHTPAGAIQTVPVLTDSRAAIAPMIKTDWDQDAPYNNQCPKLGTERTYTGCVATAMAQVMNYWQYPECGSGSISYDAETLDKRLSLNFALEPFDWANMLPNYSGVQYTEAQANAVAYLMKACGYAVKMDYGVDSSGALAMNISNALTKYFGYDGNLSYVLRMHYDRDQWEKMLYDNLRDCGPILYGGGSFLGGGHSFICDGYEDGLFHFNWGWAGMANGYFSIDALNPYAVGIGGGSGGGFNFTQDAVLGIQPPTGAPVETRQLGLSQAGSLDGTVSGSTLTLSLVGETEASWVNYTATTLKLQMGLIIEPTAGGDPIYVPFGKAFSLKAGYGVMPSGLDPTIDLASLNLPQGTYKATAATKRTDVSDAPWVPVQYNNGYYNYINITRGELGYKVSAPGYAELTVTGGGVSSDFYYGMSCKVFVEVANNSEFQLSKGFAPAFIYGNELVLLGESVLLTVDPGQKLTYEWVTPIYGMSQNFTCETDKQLYMTFFDETTYNFYLADMAKIVTLHPNPGFPEMVTAAPPEILNSVSTIEPYGNGYAVVYRVTDTRNIDVQCDLKLVSGAFGYPVYAIAAQPSDQAGMMNIINYAGETMIFDTPGQKQTFRTHLSIPYTAAGDMYYLLMGFGYGSSLAQIGPHAVLFRLMENDGVTDVAADPDAISYDGYTIMAPGHTIELYTLQGVKVAETHSVLATENLASGVYVARAGNKTLKVIK